MSRESAPYRSPFLIALALATTLGAGTLATGADKDTEAVDRTFNAVGICEKGARLILGGPSDDTSDTLRFPLACLEDGKTTKPLAVYSLTSPENAVNPDPREPGTAAFKVTIGFQNDRIPVVTGMLGNFPMASIEDEGAVVIDHAARFNVALIDHSITKFE